VAGVVVWVSGGRQEGAKERNRPGQARRVAGGGFRATVTWDHGDRWRGSGGRRRAIRSRGGAFLEAVVRKLETGVIYWSGQLCCRNHSGHC